MTAFSLIATIVLGGWLLALVLGITLVKARRDLSKARVQSRRRENSVESCPTGKDAVAQNLIVVRLELQRMGRAGQLESEESDRLLGQIDDFWKEFSLQSGAQQREQTWEERRDAGWRVLAAHGCVPQGMPPWNVWEARNSSAIQVGIAKQQARPAESLEATAAQDEPVSSEAKRTPVTQVSMSATAASASTPTLYSASPETTAVSATPEPVVPADEVASTAQQHAWLPTEPSAVEKALRTASGWPRAMMPFLIQNIGWFIGVFCFLAGSIFLISYTSGFAKAMTVCAVIFGYTGFLIWAGYQLRLKQPKARTASSALLIMGMLLVPLNFSAGARLLMSAGDSFLLWIAALVAAVIIFGVFAVAAQVISGVIDRVLSGQFPRVFLMLAACQLLAPLVVWWPIWPLLALAHGALLVLLGYGLLRYAKVWIRSIFVERRKIAYFAAGSLLYAALVAFVHLTWGAGFPGLPKGYYAPYLMSVCGLLFYLDAKFKTEVHQHSFLSRFTFFLYGLSVCALILALDATAASIITLTLAAVIYGVVLWKYLTLVPFYLLIGALGGLYALVVLQHFPDNWHFLLSLPPLFVVFAFSRWIQGLEAGRPGARRLALMSYRCAVMLLMVMALWSLIHSFAGMLAVSTAVTLAGALWWVMAIAPGPLVDGMWVESYATSLEYAAHDLRDSAWLYMVTLAMTVAVVFVPPWFGAPWDLRLAFGLTLLGALWTWLFLRVRRINPGTRQAQAEVLANSALLSVFAGLGLGGGFFANEAFNLIDLGQAIGFFSSESIGVFLLVVVFGLASGVFVSLSFSLYARWLFYAFLLTAAASVGIVKLSFFPAPSVGFGEMLAALGLWGLLWWLDRQPDEVSLLRQERAQSAGPMTLLWLVHTCMDGGTDSSRVGQKPDGGEHTSRSAVVDDEPPLLSLRGDAHV